MIPLWRGSANTWDCDEMGHMNVRVYIEKAVEGWGVFSHAIGMPHAFRPNTPSVLLPKDQHIRFVAEAHAGRPLEMLGCVVEVGDSDCVLFQELRHGDGRLCAAFRTRLQHARSDSGTPFPWSARTKAALEKLIDTPPEDTKPRSFDPDGAYIEDNEATINVPDHLGVPVIGRGIVPPIHCDPHGRMYPYWFIGRISDSVPNLLHEWRSEVARNAGGVRMGAAVLEYRLVYRKWPRAGDLFQVRTGLAKVERKVHSLVHWVVDPVSGDAWLTSEAAAISFDLDRRKAIAASPEAMGELEKLAPKGLRL